jgi:hypothetical protein
MRLGQEGFPASGCKKGYPRRKQCMRESIAYKNPSLSARSKFGVLPFGFNYVGVCGTSPNSEMLEARLRVIPKLIWRC